MCDVAKCSKRQRVASDWSMCFPFLIWLWCIRVTSKYTLTFWHSAVDSFQMTTVSRTGLNLTDLRGMRFQFGSSFFPSSFSSIARTSVMPLGLLFGSKALPPVWLRVPLLSVSLCPILSVNIFYLSCLLFFAIAPAIYWPQRYFMYMFLLPVCPLPSVEPQVISTNTSTSKVFITVTKKPWAKNSLTRVDT